MLDSTWNRLSMMIERGDLNSAERGKLLLYSGCDVLQMEIGFLTQIDDDCQSIIYSTDRTWSGLHFNLQQTLCQFTLEHDDIIASHDLSSTDWDAFDVIPPFQFGSYIGIPVKIADNLFGTLFFAGKKARKNDFTAREHAYLKMMTGSLRVIIQQEFLTKPETVVS